ncbi:MAG TPA: hypothetical protein VEK33_23805 [Terriglobales bacterium]|nr:hypothetical protein [Terriglobales bacterium]
MRTSLLRLSLLLILCGSTATYAAAHSAYYLVLGDSLAVGVQPTASGDRPTNQGYVDDLYKAFHTCIPGLVLARFCPGETTSTMLDGGICSYSAGSQLVRVRLEDSCR